MAMDQKFIRRVRNKTLIEMDRIIPPKNGSSEEEAMMEN
jgi:hypothetical protein